LAMQEGNRVNVGGMNTHFQSSDEAPYGSHEIARFARNERAARGFLSPLAAGGLPLRGDCERIAQLEPRFDALWERWKRFAASEQPLHELLMADASSSVPGYWG